MFYEIALEVKGDKRFIIEVKEERFITIHNEWLKSEVLERMEFEGEYSSQAQILVTKNVLCFLREYKSLEKRLKSVIEKDTITDFYMERPEGEFLEDYIPYGDWKTYIAEITWDRLKELQELRKEGRK